MNSANVGTQVAKPLACPKCKTVNQIHVGARPVCSKCGFGAPQPPATAWTAPQPTAPTETRILTVPIDNVNDELQVRQAFGWRLIQNTARSFATHGNAVGVGTTIGGVAVGTGRVQLNNAHFTDLTLERVLDARGQRQKALEAEYDSIQYQPNASGWIAGGFCLGAAVAGMYAGGSLLKLNDNLAIPALAIFLGLPVVGLVIGIGVRRRIHAQRVASNQRAESRQRELIAQGSR